MELITAFTSEYMQQAADGCQMSQTYLQLLACTQFVQETNVAPDDSPFLTDNDYMDINDMNNQNNSSVSGSPFIGSTGRATPSMDKSYTGISRLLKATQKQQKRNESNLLRRRNESNTSNNLTKKKSKNNNSIQYDSDGEKEKEQDRSYSSFSKNSFFIGSG